MIIFDDLKFREWVIHNRFEYYKSRNHAFQALARTVSSEEELYRLMREHMGGINSDIETEDELRERAWFYYNLFEGRKPVEPHSVCFDIREIEEVQKVKGRTNKRINLALLFLFKYFHTSNIKVTVKELLLMTGSSCNRYSYRDLVFCSQVKPCVSKLQIKDKSRIHTRMYHYNNRYRNNDIEYLYEGDIYCVAGERFRSNLKDFCDRILYTDMRQVSL